tara:strand:+ start:1101 stop:1304 length:204 start_codon:yes stop_codon:yes gene_type:complete
MSLTSTRRPDQPVILNIDSCEFLIEVYEVNGDPVRLDITASESVDVFRSELLEKKRIKNGAKSTSGA